jgi:putative flavoprotein involved in K+ transport
MPIFDSNGYPIHQRGITTHPGLYFIGLQYLHKAKSSLLFGVGDDAAYITDHIERSV